MKMIKNYADKNVLVLGAGKSGVNAAKLLVKLGAHVTLNDSKQLADLPEVAGLEDLGIKVVSGGHPDTLFSKPIDVLVKNPGIFYENPVVEYATNNQIPIITEVELAYEISEAEIIGVTGSNGKTTTTTMIAKILNEDRKQGKAYVAGNIGVPATQVAQMATKDDTIVMELSSFMLMGIKDLHPHIAVLNNIFSNHLDYHHTRENYVKAKMEITKNQNSNDYFVVNFDQAEWRDLSEQSQAKVVPFARNYEISTGAYEKNGKIYFNDEFIMNSSDIKVPGKQNIENALAAIAVAKVAGKSNLAITNVLETFSGVRHRNQFVLESEGRRYYNDSKATDIEATQIALEGFDRPVILLAGGLDRGYNFDKLIPQFKDHVKAAVLFGETAPLLKETLEKAGINNFKIVKDVTEAVPVAYNFSDAGDIILLSPANASWDQYPNFEVRGDTFITAVEKFTNDKGEA